MACNYHFFQSKIVNFFNLIFIRMNAPRSFNMGFEENNNYLKSDNLSKYEKRISDDYDEFEIKSKNYNEKNDKFDKNREEKEKENSSLYPNFNTNLSAKKLIKVQSFQGLNIVNPPSAISVSTGMNVQTQKLIKTRTKSIREMISEIEIRAKQNLSCPVYVTKLDKLDKDILTWRKGVLSNEELGE